MKETFTKDEMINSLKNDLQAQKDKKLNYYKKMLVRATKYLKENPNGIITSTILVIKDNEEAKYLPTCHDDGSDGNGIMQR